MTHVAPVVVALAVSALLSGCAPITQPASAAAAPAPLAELARLEAGYADLNDAIGALGLIDSGLVTSHLGKDRQQWQADYVRLLAAVRGGLHELRAGRLAPEDERAVRLIRASVAALQEGPDSLAPVGRCSDAGRAGLGRAELQEALYACFAELANNLEFEGGKVTRVAAFDLLTRMDEPARRRNLFYAFVPLWQAVNGQGEASSPYRRMLALAAAEARRKGSEVDAAARTVGVPSAAIEGWLEQILDTWRQVTPATPVEPWDYRYAHGAAERELGNAIAREQLLPMSQRFYRDLGADLEALAILHDLDPRPGKAPLAYTDYVSRGRMTGGAWRPTVVRVSGNYGRGGLGLLNELVHEDGHAVHMMALRTRPAFMDLGDTLFLEAFADVPSWSVYEPAWQQRYLGRAASEAASLRSLYASVMLDVAWALFDLRLLRDPSADPNRVWTDITSRYLHVVPHPELSWWAVRVQLVDKPGYMVNYGLGAVLTADMRQSTRGQIGPFDAGNPRWYGWLTARLLASGQQHETATLLREFLGRPTSPAALLAELRRLQGPPAARPPVDAGRR